MKKENLKANFATYLNFVQIYLDLVKPFKGVEVLVQII